MKLLTHYCINFSALNPTLVYLMIILIHQSPQKQMVLPLVSYELQRICKELCVAHSRYYVRIDGYTGMTLCLWMSGCWGFKGSQWLHLKVNQSSKCWQPLTQQHSVTSQTQILSKSALRTSNLTLYIFRVSTLHM
jgi:hypothetical protein